MNVPTYPSWLTSPCPAWCTYTHGETDPPRDRFHWSGALAHVSLSKRLPLTHAETIALDAVWVVLTQYVDEQGPATVTLVDEANGSEIDLAPGEAEQLAAVLLMAATTA